VHRKLILGATIACAFLAAAAPAGATIVPLTFDHMVLDTPATPKMQVVTPKTQPLTVNADVNFTNGTFTVQPSDWHFPVYTMTQPVPGTVDIELKGPASGAFDPSTGNLTFNADFLATINVQGYGECTKDTGPLTLSTTTTEPIAGHPFPATATGAQSGDGAFGAGWTSLAPGTGPACATLVDPAVQGKGGIWISRGISPVPPKLSMKVTTPKKVKAGSKATVKVTVSESGADQTSPIKVCLADPKPLSPRMSCTTLKTGLAEGKSKTITFKVKTAKKKAGKYTLKATATIDNSTGVAVLQKKATLKVHR